MNTNNIKTDGMTLLLLGGFDIHLNERLVTNSCYNKMRALLAYFVMAPELEHRREFLAALLWSNNDAITARGNLRRTLSDLRRVLELPSGQTLFLASKDTIRFIPNIYIDVLEFSNQISTPSGKSSAAKNREERIIDLYRGEFLAGLCLPDCPDFEHWLLIQRDTLLRRALSMLEQLSNQYAQTGEYDTALRLCLRQVELAPLDERAHAQAMRLYALNDQKNAALNQFESCCILLAKELNALPTEKTRHLADCIRNNELNSDLEDVRKTRPPPISSQSAAERRQVTVLFCEITLSSEIDDADEEVMMLSAPQARCMEIIQQYSGYLVQMHGAGLLAYFGYPRAHEDSARHALKAALAITREIHHNIEICAGVHTGQIITGENQSILDTTGRTTKLAMNLCQDASPNNVIISQLTHSITSGYFDCYPLGFRPLPGCSVHHKVFKVLRENGARTRIETTRQLSPFVGRKAEIAMLMALWEETAQNGRRHVALVQGEPGIGKSRLLHALKVRLIGTPHAIREIRCSAEVSHSPFFPIIELFEQILDFRPGETPDLKLAKLVKYVELYYPRSTQEIIPILARLFSLPLDEYHDQQNIPQQILKARTHAVLLEMMYALSTQLPLLIIVEDLHWIDPSTRELLTLFVERPKKGAVFALFTARPEFDPPWEETSELLLVLEPLMDDEVVELITSIDSGIHEETIHCIVEQTDGVPLFVEEMARFSDKQLHIPATLQDLLAARIDNTGEAKYTAQLAATIGREFSLDLLGKMFLSDTKTLRHSLKVLQEAGLILQIDEATSRFKHALVQEAAYKSQTKAGRQILHQRVAQTLVSHFDHVVNTRPEFIAYHLTEGGESRRAIEFWIKAGQRDILRAAHVEAVEHLNSGLQLLMTLPSDKERDRLEFGLCVNLGIAAAATKGYGSDMVEQAYVRALELGERLDDSNGLFMTLWGMWLNTGASISHLQALKIAEKMLCLAVESKDSVHLQQAYHAMGYSLVRSGQFAAGRIHLVRSMELYDPSHHDVMVSQYGKNTWVTNASILSWVLWLQGFPDQAREFNQRTLAMARQVNHPPSLGHALCNASILAGWLKEPEISRELAHEATALSSRHGLSMGMIMGNAIYGWVIAMQGQAEGIAEMQQCMDSVNTVMGGARLVFAALLSEACVYLKKFEDALVGVNEVLSVVNTTDGTSHFDSEFHRLKGVCLLKISATNTGKAEVCFNKALAISRKQGAKSLELRATISMTRLWLGQGKRDEAQRLLEEIYNWFTEGFDTPDLKLAAKLLDSFALD